MERKAKLSEKKNLKKGDIFEFGLWKEKPIEWQVLAVGSSILCISKYCLEKRRFDSKSSNWEKSELRHWLNSDFYDKAFNFEEKSFILSYEGDKVTLLSEEEAEKYFPTKSDRVAILKDGSRAWWWLRSSNRKNFYIANIDYYNGDIYYTNVDCISGALRPVIYLKKDVENFLEIKEF